MSAYAIHTTLKQAFLIVCLSAAICVSDLNLAWAEDPETLTGVLEKHRLATFEDVGKYVDAHPDAQDISEAYFYLFRQGLLHDMEVRTLPFAESYLKRDDQNQALSGLAQRVRCMAMAQQGDFEAAYVVFESLLAQARPQEAESMLGVGFTLASKARGAGKVGISRDIYERLSAAFPFNQKISKMTQTGLLKHDLLGKPAPALDVPDMEGKQVDWQQYEGKVVLVDFWATWCGPCLEEMPNLKTLYKDLHDQGFEIIGINEDGDPEQVKEYLKSAGITWRQIMDESDELKLGERFEATLLPSTFLVDRKGTIVQFDLRGGEIRRQVEELLEKK